MYRVLVVPADLLDSAGATTEALAAFAITSQTVAAARPAVALAEAWEPHAIVFDSQLADMPAAELCRRVRALPALRRTKLLMVTRQVGGTSFGHLGSVFDDFADVDSDGHLVRPADLAQLVSTLAALIGRPDERGVAVEQLATIDTGDDRAPVLATTREIGESRMRIEAQDRLAVGAQVTVRVQLPGAAAALEIASVVQCLIDQMQLRYELRFYRVSPEDREVLREFLARGDGAESRST